MDANPYRAEAPAAYWAAETALRSASANPSPALLAAYFAKVMAVWPEVMPRLEGLAGETLRAWAAAAATRPDICWNTVLVGYAGDDPDQLARGFEWLRLAAAAPSSGQGGTAAEAAAIRAAAADPRLVAALRQSWQQASVASPPVGWAGILLAEGDPESVALVRQLMEAHTLDALFDETLDELRAMLPATRTPATAQLAAELDALLTARDEANGQNDLFRALDLAEPPATFRFTVTRHARSGHRFVLAANRDRRGSAVHWSVFLRKQQPGYLGRPSGIQTNRLKLPEVTLGTLPEWLRTAADRLKTRWDGPLELDEDGFTASLRPALERWLS